MSAVMQRSVVIAGVDDLDKEFIDLIYTNPSKSGGGEIEHIVLTKDGCAVVTFKSAEVARAVVERRLTTLTNYQLEASWQVPEERRSVLVKGTGHLTKETLDLLFTNESKTGGGDIADIQLDTEKGSAFVIFTKAADADAVVKKGSVTFQGLTLSMSWPDQCDGNASHGHLVKVEPIGDLNEEDLRLLYQNSKKSGGGPIDKVQLQLGNFATIKFTNYSDAERVVEKRTSYLGNHELYASWYTSGVSLRRRPQADTAEHKRPAEVKTTTKLFTELKDLHSKLLQKMNYHETLETKYNNIRVTVRPHEVEFRGPNADTNDAYQEFLVFLMTLEETEVQISSDENTILSSKQVQSELKLQLRNDHVVWEICEQSVSIVGISKDILDSTAALIKKCFQSDKKEAQLEGSEQTGEQEVISLDTTDIEKQNTTSSEVKISSDKESPGAEVDHDVVADKTHNVMGAETITTKKGGAGKKPKIPSWKELRLFQNGRMLCVMQDDIFNVQTDVMVNPTNPKLDLSHGFISQKILEKAGSKIQDELNKKRSKVSNIGDIIITTGYGLKCQHIYHTACPQNAKDTDLKSKLFHTLKKCIKRAEKEKIGIITFSSIGAGQLKFPRDMFAECLIKTFRDRAAKGNKPFPHTVQLVLHWKDSETYKEMVKAVNASTPQQNKPKTDPAYEIVLDTKVQHVSFQIVKGDISTQKTDVIYSVYEKRRGSIKSRVDTCSERYIIERETDMKDTNMKRLVLEALNKTACLRLRSVSFSVPAAKHAESWVSSLIDMIQQHVKEDTNSSLKQVCVVNPDQSTIDECVTLVKGKAQSNSTTDVVTPIKDVKSSRL